MDLRRLPVNPQRRCLLTAASAWLNGEDWLGRISFGRSEFGCVRRAREREGARVRYFQGKKARSCVIPKLPRRLRVCRGGSALAENVNAVIYGRRINSPFPINHHLLQLAPQDIAQPDVP